MEGFADATFKKAIFILPLGAFITWAVHIDGAYWISISLALTLMVAKTGVALSAIGEEMPCEYDLHISRQRMLIRGSILLTMVMGVVSLSAWVILAKRLIDYFGHILLNYKSAIAFLIGVGLHLH